MTDRLKICECEVFQSCPRCERDVAVEEAMAWIEKNYPRFKADPVEVNGLAKSMNENLVKRFATCQLNVDEGPEAESEL